MPYYGYTVVTVEDYRTVMTSADNGEVQPTGLKAQVRIEDAVADEFMVLRGLDASALVYAAVLEIVGAVRSVREEVRKGDLSERWHEATRSMSAAQMEAALAAIEATPR